MNDENISTFIQQEYWPNTSHPYVNRSFYYKNRNGDIYGFYLGIEHNERTTGINKWSRTIGDLSTDISNRSRNVYDNLIWFTSIIINDVKYFQSQFNNPTLLQEIDTLKQRNQSLEKDLKISRKVNLDLLQENEKFKKTLEMINTQSQTEFDKTATIIGYERQKQILQEMFEEQRRVLSQQLQELTTINIPGTRSLTQLTIALMINRIKSYFSNDELDSINPQTHINTPQESQQLDLSGTTDEIFKQFYPKKQNE